MVRKFRRKTMRRIRRRAGGKSRRRVGGKSRRRVGGKSRRRAGGKSRRRGGENSIMNQKVASEKHGTIDSTGDDPLKNISINNIRNEEIRKLLDMENPTFKKTPEFQKGIKVKLNKDNIENDIELINSMARVRERNAQIDKNVSAEMPLIEKLNKMAGEKLLGTDGMPGLLHLGSEWEKEFKIIEIYPQKKPDPKSVVFSGRIFYIIEGIVFQTPEKLLVPQNWLVKV